MSINGKIRMLAGCAIGLSLTMTAAGCDAGAARVKTVSGTPSRSATSTVAPAAVTGDQTLTFYLASAGLSFVTATGKPFTVSRSHLPKIGYQQERTDLLYVGDQSNHAADWTATDHQLCIFNSGGDAVCHAQVAIGGSMILSKVTLGAPTGAVTETITGGTGAYQGVTGTVIFKNISTGSPDGDLTINLFRS